METNFYKTLSDNLNSRGKQKANLLHEAFQLREKSTSLLIQLQDLVHPKKWITVEEAKQRILSEAAQIKETNTLLHYDNNPNYKKELEIDYDQIESIMKQADILLEDHAVVNDTNLV